MTSAISGENRKATYGRKKIHQWNATYPLNYTGRLRESRAKATVLMNGEMVRGVSE